MKYFNAGLCAIVIFCVCGTFATPLLGAKECTYGPSYWCSNLSNAKECHAVRHCIQTVWEKREVPVDNDSICQICKDMVTQARDQLRSNETMEELKEVFDGSCNLIPVKVIKKECCKLADDFIPELVEALSSQMNPDQVCSVAGLCNNAKIDQQLMEAYAGALSGSLSEENVKDVAEKELAPSSVPAKKPELKLTCGNCNQLSSRIMNKFEATNRDEILENILHLCGELSSFSDACSNIVLTYFNDIYDHLKHHLSSEGVCHFSGVCASRYHQHEDDLKPQPTEELVSLDGGDDIPCELCQQLVKHLRDLLVANTTESEFKQVLDGFCKQTQGFKDECLSIVDQYYHVIYETLVQRLDANGACFLIGVCPKGANKIFEGPIMPLLPALPPAKIEVTIKKLGANEPKFTQDEIIGMTIPIDHLMGAANPSLLVENGELCTICEYMLHFVQETLATPATEDEIKNAVNTICNKLPSGVRGQCHNFIDMYGDAVIALLIQGLSPRSVCPALQMCPKNIEHSDDIEVIAPSPIDEMNKPTCPLCLFAVKEAQERIKNDKSKTNIKKVLDHLCSPLPTNLRGECIDFVETYSGELVDMLITDFKPDEICTQLKLCPSNTDDYLANIDIDISEESDESDERTNENSIFNEIDTSNELPIEVTFERAPDAIAPPNCLICEELVKEAEKRINKHMTKDEIKKSLEHACEKLRKPLQPKCHKYVDKYGDLIANLLLKEMEPKLICREIGLCISSEQEDLEIDEALKYDVIALPKQMTPSERLEVTVKEPPTCVLCEFVMTKLEMELKNKTEQDEIKHAVESICEYMPKTIAKSCDKFIEQYANTIISLISTVPPKEICKNLQLCLSGISQAITDEVIECGVCHGVTQALLPFFRQHNDRKNVIVQDMMSVACENLPAKYYTICSEMISIYGISILHLSEKPYINESFVCTEIGKCFDNEKSGLAFARISA